MERIEPTRKDAVRVWWAFIWRAMLFALLSGFVIGILFGVFALVAKIDPQNMQGPSQFLGLVIGIGVSIEVMYRVLKKKFKDFEIVLVRREDGEQA